MNKLKALAIFIFVASIAIIMGFLCAATKIYYWSLSPEGLALWMSIAGHVIRIGDVLK